ncbi:MAG: MFS transporter, partial [Actinomycetes bacterium]
VGAAFGMGFIIGPYLGGKLSEPHVSFYHLFHTPSWFSATTPFWFASILALLNCVAVLTTFPETIKEKVHSGRLHAAQAISNVIEGFSSERLRTVLLVNFLFTGGFTFFTTFFGVYLRNNFGFSASKTGDYFAIVGLFIAFAQAVVVGRVAKKLADYKVLRFSMFGNATMLLVYFAIPTNHQLFLYLTIPFFTLFNGLTMANMSSLVSRSAEPGKQGQAMGISSSVASLAQVPASILLGYITSSITSSQPLVVAAACIYTGGILFVLLFRPKFVSDTVGQSLGAPAH